MYCYTQRQEWLKGALEAMCSAPSETDLMKAALAVLRSHRIPSSGSDIGEDTKNAMMKAFDEVIYFIEDLDHAKGNGCAGLVRMDYFFGNGVLPQLLSYFLLCCLRVN